ncbi:MAG: sigma-70 family RNA polymerase sigma factor [Bacteroidetes bacterium]|nr:sigma-70 family RNA polymerase sigma factor [Bacteroidota bacterium]
MDFDSIYKTYYQELYYFAIRQNLVSAEATDTVQDVYTAFYKEIQAGKQIENPKAWLYSSLLNSVRTRYKQHKSRQQKNIEYASGIEVIKDTQSEYNEKERRSIVEACLSTMEPGDRNLMLLYHKGFSYREISEILQINYNSVGTCIARTTQKLTFILKSKYHELFE